MSINPFHHSLETIPASPIEVDARPIPSPSERGFLDEELATVHYLPYSGDRRNPTGDPYVINQLFHTAHGAVHVPHASEPVKYTLTVPAEVVHPTIHLIVPGFGGFKSSSRGLRNSLSQHQGTAAISFEPPRQGRLLEDLFDAQRLHTDTIDAILDDVAYNEQLQDIDSAAQLDLSSVVLDPHSMGSLSATRYALAHSQNVKSITYIESVGLEDPRPWRFMSRLLPAIIQDIGPSIAKGELRDYGTHSDLLLKAIHYYGRNPLRTVGEIASCMKGDIRDSVIALKAAGVKQAMLYGDRDPLLPAELSVNASAHLVDHCEVMPNAGHAAPQAQAQRVASRLALISRKLAS
jgi:pimeloyl-ACP methyl ester carboxylesterase